MVCRFIIFELSGASFVITATLSKRKGILSKEICCVQESFMVESTLERSGSLLWRFV